jgi:hypothetical protein
MNEIPLETLLNETGRVSKSHVGTRYLMHLPKVSGAIKIDPAGKAGTVGGSYD